jgi:hypothetical protein
MKILQKNGGFKPEELRAYTYIIYGNIISQMKGVVAASFRLRIEIKSVENRVRFTSAIHTTASLPLHILSATRLCSVWRIRPCFCIFR